MTPKSPAPTLLSLGQVEVPVGELDLCPTCECSPHLLGCFEHADYDDPMIAYYQTNAEQDFGPARYWVEDTFAADVESAGVIGFEAFGKA